MRAGEFELIEKIRQLTTGAEGLRIGIGDDCSVFELAPDKELLTSTDLLLEGVHFRLDWTNTYDLGRKAVSVNVSDIAAMGGRPLSLHLGLGIPAQFEEKDLDSFLGGFVAAMKDYGVCLAGGDTCLSAGPLTLAVTVQGVCSRGQAITRAGAGAGDDLWVSGSLGDSALALHRLQRGQAPEETLAGRHFDPRARVELGWQLGRRQLATAMIDISDGLAGDLGHLLRASGCGARVELQKIPHSAAFEQALSRDAALLELALSGGEDYELLFSTRPEARADVEQLSLESGLRVTRIGELNASERCVFQTLNGTPYRLKSEGYDHFSNRSGATSRG